MRGALSIFLSANHSKSQKWIKRNILSTFQHLTSSSVSPYKPSPMNNVKDEVLTELMVKKLQHLYWADCFSEKQYPLPPLPESLIFSVVIVSHPLLVTSKKQSLFYIIYIPSSLAVFNDLKELKTCSQPSQYPMSYKWHFILICRFSMPKWIIYKLQLVGSNNQLPEIYTYTESCSPAGRMWSFPPPFKIWRLNRE